MTERFDPQANLIIVKTEVFGPKRDFVLSLALDTGATGTLISQSSLLRLGYDLTQAQDQVQITTGSSIEYAPRILLGKLTALGQVRTDFPILGHNLPPSASVDGLLGLDFFRGLNLNIDFRDGLITLA